MLFAVWCFKLSTMQPVWDGCYSRWLEHMIKTIDSYSYVILKTPLAYSWGNKIDTWVHRKWHMSVDWVWGFDIELYCINEVFWWQSEQSYVMCCRNLIHCTVDGSTWKTRREQTLTIVKAQITSEICQVVLKYQIWRKRLGTFSF